MPNVCPTNIPEIENKTNKQTEGKEIIQGSAPTRGLTFYTERAHCPAQWWRHILTKPHCPTVSEH